MARTVGVFGLLLVATAARLSAEPPAKTDSGAKSSGAVYASRPVAERLVGTWQLRNHAEIDRFQIRADGTFDWTMPTGEAHSTLAGEWDVIDRTMILIYGNENLRVTLGRVDAVTPSYLAFNYADQKLMFERIPRTHEPKYEPSEVSDASLPDK